MPTKTITLFGIPHCDTVKKSRRWFEEAGWSVAFQDFKKNGVPEAAVQAWLGAWGRAEVLNRKGTTWRALSPEAQARALSSDAEALALARAQPSVLRRPVEQWDSPTGVVRSLGYCPELWATWALE